MAASHIFKVLFVNQGKVYEIYARKVSHGTLFGFIEVEELVFGERSTVVVDPAEEKIKAEFNDVKRTYLPMHSVLRIDEVRKQGVSKIVALEGSNVSQFPVPIYTPGGDSNARKGSARIPHVLLARRARGRSSPHAFRGRFASAERSRARSAREAADLRAAAAPARGARPTLAGHP